MADQPPITDTPNPSPAEAAPGDPSGGASTQGTQAPSDPAAHHPGERGPTEQPITVPEPGATPFEREGAVLGEGVAIRDDISATQAAPTATRDVSSLHIARLLYQPIGAPGGPVYQAEALEQRLRARRP